MVHLPKLSSLSQSTPSCCVLYIVCTAVHLETPSRIGVRGHPVCVRETSEPSPHVTKASCARRPHNILLSLAGTEWRPPISLVEANHRDSPPLKLGVGAQEIASLKVSAVPRVCITAHIEDGLNDPGKTLIPARSTDDVLVQTPWVPVGMSTMLNIHLTWGGGEGQHIERCSMVGRRGAAERETGRFSRAQGGWVGDRGHRRQGMAYVILLGAETHLSHFSKVIWMPRHASAMCRRTYPARTRNHLA